VKSGQIVVDFWGERMMGLEGVFCVGEDAGCGTKPLCTGSAEVL